MKRATVVFLGPQRHEPGVDRAVASLGIEGRIAAITAGWEEREQEDRELAEHLGGRVFNLEIHQRAEDVYTRDPELYRAMLDRHQRLRGLQELYRLRLAHGLAAARELLGRAQQDPSPDLASEAGASVDDVRDLDAEHLARLAKVHSEFERTHACAERESVARHRRELSERLDGAGALAVAGGHVGILLSRLRLFAMGELLAGLPVIAWSAGAMVLSERIVLFHDSPPQGAGNAEVFDHGLGLAPRLVALPHARKRLRLEDATRVGLFARRFGPALCAVLESGSRFDWNGEQWSAGPNSRRLTPEGQVTEGVPA